jgi:hypothetical protein
MSRYRIKCAGCKERIPSHEPDLILRRMAESDPTKATLTLLYHERCKGAALSRVAGEPALWRMTHRYIDAVAN